jgi:prepilin-type processing-associated H-X9-DG protein
MSQEDMMVIAAWVVGGSPKGDPAFLPVSAPAVNTQPEMQDALIVTNRLRLAKPLQVAGIRPIMDGKVDSARIVASFADGHVEPLLWLYQYDSAGNKVFAFRQPVLLPRGTVVEGSEPITFALEVVHAQ